MSNAHPSTGLQNSYKYHINYIYSTINNNERETGERIAVKLRQFIVWEIDPYLSIPYQVRSELPSKSQKS